MGKAKWKKRAKWIAGILAVHYLLAGELSPLTYYRAHLLGQRICEAAEAGMFDEPKGHYEFTDLLYVGPSLTEWLDRTGTGLKKGCQHKTKYHFLGNGVKYRLEIWLTGPRAQAALFLSYYPNFNFLACNLGAPELCGWGLKYRTYGGSNLSN